MDESRLYIIRVILQTYYRNTTPRDLHLCITTIILCIEYAAHSVILNNILINIFTFQQVLSNPLFLTVYFEK